MTKIVHNITGKINKKQTKKNKKNRQKLAKIFHKYYREKIDKNRKKVNMKFDKNRP